MEIFKYFQKSKEIIHFKYHKVITYLISLIIICILKHKKTKMKLKMLLNYNLIFYV